MILRLAKAVKRAGRDKRGFTLVELMAVLAVLAIISAIAVPKFTNTIETAKKKADDATLAVLNRILDQYILDHDGQTPDDTDDLLDYIDSGTWPVPQQGGKFVLDDEKDDIIIE